MSTTETPIPTATITAVEPTPIPVPTSPETITEAPTTTVEASSPPKPEPGAVPTPPETAPATEPTPTPTAAPTAELTAAPTETQPTPTITEMPTTTAEPTPAPTAATQPPTATATATTTPAVPAEKPEEDNSDEPQNELTKRFTGSEWDALKKFRVLLPEIFSEAYVEKPEEDRQTPINLWGVNIDPTNPKEARASVVLMKFLRARNLNPTAAKDMMVATLRWRDEFNIEAALKEDYPKEIFGQLGHVYGRDKGGRPVVYNLYGANKDLKAVFGDVERFLRWRVALMEQSVALLDFETTDQTVQIHDYEGVGFTSRDANSKRAASEATSIFSNHYPELLHRKFFINVPTILNWVFWLFKPIIPAATLAKMEVVGSSQYAIKKALVPVIDEKQLPKRYGGEADAGF